MSGIEPLLPFVVLLAYLIMSSFIYILTTINQTYQTLPFFLIHDPYFELNISSAFLLE